MLAEFALAALMIFPWSLLAVPVSLKLLKRWRCYLCVGAGSLATVNEDRTPSVVDCEVCRGWGYVPPWRPS